MVSAVAPVRACILLADDHRPMRNTIKNLLSASNPTWEICEAGTGSEAIQQTVALQPDVVMLDLNLPDMPGDQVAVKIRQLSPNIKIVFCSLTDANELSAAMQKAGVDAYISKMAPIEEFQSTLAGLIQGSA